jgi:hypothetical protein
MERERQRQDEPERLLISAKAPNIVGFNDVLAIS